MDLGQPLFGFAILLVGYLIIFKIPYSFFEGYRVWAIKQVGPLTLHALGAALCAGGILVPVAINTDGALTPSMSIGLCALGLIGLIVIISSLWYWAKVYRRH